MTAAFSTPTKPIPLPPVPPDVVLEPCPQIPGKAACTSPGGPIYLDPQHGSWRALWHELGHQFDYQAMSDYQRDRFRTFSGDLRPWGSQPNGPKEKFAEAYRLCALGWRPFEKHVEGAFHYRVTVKRQHRICILIRNAGTIVGAPTYLGR